jgi:Zn-finger protein
MESIIQKEKNCFLCGCVRNLERHHVWHGVNRKNAEKDGLTVWLCVRCHRNLHDKGLNDKTLMEVGERAWLRETGGTIEDFIRRYGKNVI